MISLAIHGGAGIMSRDAFTAQEYEAYRSALSQVLTESYSALEDKMSAVEVVALAVKTLEDCPLFNAGRGSVLDAQGNISMDASIMCGRSLEVGGVADCMRLKNPVLAAKWVMENSPHVVLAGRWLEEYLGERGFELESQDYFRTEKRYEQYKKAKMSGKILMDHWVGDSNTVGAVAKDYSGNLAAATSTGGLTGKFPGRISDTCVVGAGNYANNETCAISGTGTGDVFLRMSFCYDVHAQMLYKSRSIEESGRHSLKTLSRLGGIGGLIAVNKAGEIVMDHNSEGMFCASQQQGAQQIIHIFK